MGLPEPAGNSNDPLENHFLVNQRENNIKEVLFRLARRKSWPLIKEWVYCNIDLQEAFERRGDYTDPSTLSRLVAEKIKPTMLLCTVGLIFADG